MKNEQSVSKSVISRLPRYYRFLAILEDEGVERISSNELSKRLDLTASQIRQDFNCFGGFGQQGYGYNVKQLRENIGLIIGIDKKFKIILVGAGNMGKAITLHLDFVKEGFALVGLFDNDPEIIGTEIKDMKVKNFEEIEEFCKKNKPDAAILCIPDSSGKEVTSRLDACGIKNFWNFTHYNIMSDFPESFAENVHLNDSLMKLCYNITNNTKKEDGK